MNSAFARTALLTATLTGLCSACSSSGKEWNPSPERKLYLPVYRQHAAEPVYSRMRWVHLPEPLPASEVRAGANSPRLFPVVHLELKNTSLEEAAQALAATARYRSYCASAISAQRVSVDSLGTIDELASAPADNQKVDVIVDHENRELRVMSRQPAAVFPSEASTFDKQVLPAVIEEKVLTNEHQ